MTPIARWLRIAPPLCGALALAATATTFAPWGRSGRRVRNSYRLVDVVERAGVLPHDVAGWSVVWFFVPALCGVALVAFALHRDAVAYAATASLGALVAVGGALVARSPLVLESGAALGTLTGICAMLAGTAALVTTISRRTR